MSLRRRSLFHRGLGRRSLLLLVVARARCTTRGNTTCSAGSSNRGACVRPDVSSPRHRSWCIGNAAKDSRRKHLPLVDVAIRFFVTRGLVVIVVARASVLLLRWLLGRLGRVRSLAAIGRLLTVATLSPVHNLTTLVVRIGRASAKGRPAPGGAGARCRAWSDP